MGGAQIGSTLSGTGNLATDRAWIRGGTAAAVTAMVSWVGHAATIMAGSRQGQVRRRQLTRHANRHQ
jgi:hypothetical protein